MDPQNPDGGSGAEPQQPEYAGNDMATPVGPVGPQGPIVPKIIVQTPPPYRGSFLQRLGRSILVLSIMANIYFLVTLASTGGPGEWEESIELGDKSVKEKIVVLEIDGAIGGRLVERTISQIKQAQLDEDVKGVIVEINSPGGTITGSDAIHHYLKELRSEKPVAICMEDLCASGGYYVAMAGHRVFAHPTAWTGSIGVILTLVNVVKLSEDVGIKVEVVKSGDNKDMGSPFRPLSEQDRKYFQTLVDDAHERFLTIVAEGRGMDKDRIRPLADGRVIGSDQALADKLIDEIGFLEDAIEYVKKSADLKEAKVVRYSQRFSLTGILMSRVPQSIDLKLKLPLSPLLRTGHPQPLYLWPAVGIRADIGTVLRGN